MRTCNSDDKGEIQAQKGKNESTNAENRDGATRSSVEISVMEMEQRGCIIQSIYGNNLEHDGKPVGKEIMVNREGVLQIWQGQTTFRKKKYC